MHVYFSYVSSSFQYEAKMSAGKNLYSEMTQFCVGWDKNPELNQSTQPIMHKHDVIRKTGNT